MLLNKNVSIKALVLIFIDSVVCISTDGGAQSALFKRGILGRSSLKIKCSWRWLFVFSWLQYSSLNNNFKHQNLTNISPFLLLIDG